MDLSIVIEKNNVGQFTSFYNVIENKPTERPQGDS